MRLTLYILQLNIVSSCCFLFFGASYRQSESSRDEEVIDHFDILNLIMATLTCSILFTPWLSEPLIKACSNKIIIEKGSVATARSDININDSGSNSGDHRL